MAHALRLGARGLGHVWPNPAVGCVIVREGRILGRGRTAPGGRPHAETEALRGIDATGATAYVTLEPCAHHGQTPPCTTALIKAGVARVVTALTDPDPRVAGQGHTLLRTAGIAVTEDVLGAEAARLNVGFVKRVTRGLPFVTLKLAASLDGRTALPTGESRWITGSEARRAVHLMRMTHDAVLVGSGTARADDPDLSVRDLGSAHQPVRIVLDRQLSHDPDSRLGRSARETPVWLLHGPSAPAAARDVWAATGAHLVACPTGAEGHLDLTEAMRRLATLGLTRILCEGGATLAAALVRAGLIDELAFFHAGALLGSESHPALGQLALKTLADAPRPTLVHSAQIGTDLVSFWSI